MDAVLSNLDVYGRGFLTTLALTLTSFSLALVLGVMVAASRVSPVRPLQVAGAAYVEVFRNLPLTVLMFLLYFGGPDVGLRFAEFPTAVVALSLYTGAFVGEAVRAGVSSVPRGQAEAARALGLNFPRTLLAVVLPQAVRTMVAPLGSLFVALTKNSAIAYTISVHELTFRTNELITVTAATIPVLIGSALAYLALTIPSGAATRALEGRLAIHR
ncbi:MAG: amino acid ABC transporter permease [Acidimicrobiia bacterium]